MNVNDPQLSTHQSFQTATPSRDNYGLGKTPAQRGAEILAGFRAEKTPTPETKALSKFSGRIAARLMLSMLRDNSPLNFTLARPLVIDGLIRRSLPALRTNAVLVDVAAGLSPRGLILARENPTMQVIEVDLPDVVVEKRLRLQRSRITIPNNLNWVMADLGEISLAEALGTQQAHVISCEGLLPYLNHAQIVQFASWVHESLYPDGVFIADVPLRSGVLAIQQLASFFSRQAGNWYGIIDDEQAGQQLMRDADFESVETFLSTDLAESFGLPTPLIDISCFLQARKHTAS